MSPFFVKALLGLLILISQISSIDLDECDDGHRYLTEHLNAIKGKTIAELTKSSYIIDVNGKVSTSTQKAEDSTDILLVNTSEGLRQIQKTMNEKTAENILSVERATKGYCSNARGRNDGGINFFSSDCFIMILRCVNGANNSIYLISSTYESDMSDKNMLEFFSQQSPQNKGEILKSFLVDFVNLHQRDFIHGMIEPKYLLVTDKDASEVSIKLPPVNIKYKLREREKDLSGNKRSMFLSPEQVKNVNMATKESDVYSLALSFAWILVKDRDNFKLDNDCFQVEFSSTCEKQLQKIKDFEFADEKMMPFKGLINAIIDKAPEKRGYSMLSFKNKVQEIIDQFPII